ncbi:agmatinase [Candidatus Nomurabacteria bacterium]|nr:agmatinase [Candidatus Nomurabacteria bacterium]
MSDSIINEKDIKKADVVMLSASYEKTASSHKGTADGPKAIIGQLSKQIEFFDRKLKCEPTDFIKTAKADLGNLDKHSPEKALGIIIDKCAELGETGKFVFLLGGEHSVSLGALQALSKKHKSKDITIVQIDAHCDLRNDDSDYSDDPTNYAHSCVMRRASELGFPLVQVGIRTYSRDEYNYFSNKKNDVTVFEWGAGKIPTIETILKSIKTKYVYITIDVDGFDPAHMPGTGTSVQGGLEWWYGVNLLEKIIQKKELVGADIVEVSPQHDTILTEYGAAQLCYTMIANKFKKRFK